VERIRARASPSVRAAAGTTAVARAGQNPALALRNSRWERSPSRRLGRPSPVALTMKAYPCEVSRSQRLRPLPAFPFVTLSRYIPSLGVEGVRLVGSDARIRTCHAVAPSIENPLTSIVTSSAPTIRPSSSHPVKGSRERHVGHHDRATLQMNSQRRSATGNRNRAQSRSKEPQRRPPVAAREPVRGMLARPDRDVHVPKGDAS
jgi:hypothetical protein